MAEIQQAPVTRNISGGAWGNNRFQGYYNKYLQDLPLNTVQYNELTTNDRTLQEIADEARAIYKPQMDTTRQQVMRELDNTYSNVDANLAANGMSRSTVVADQKNAAYNAGMSAMSQAYNSYLDQYAAAIEAARENQNARKQAIDRQNAANKIETDKWESQARTALEAKAYQLAAEAYERSKPKATKKPGGGDDLWRRINANWKKIKNKYTVTGDGKVATTTKRRMSGQYSGLM